MGGPRVAGASGHQGTAPAREGGPLAVSLDWANLCPKTWLWPLQYKGGALPPLYSMGCFVGGDAQYVVFEGRDVEHQKFRYKQPSIQQVLLDRGLFVPKHFVLYSFPTKTTYTMFSFIVFLLLIFGPWFLFFVYFWAMGQVT